MSNIYHILNGDALREQFPKKLSGEIIVARECLVDGPVQADDLESFFQVRAAFIAELDEAWSVETYQSNSLSEFAKIRSIPAGSKVYLWFEDDLFCQVNFWFVVHLLQQNEQVLEVFLVRPKVHTSYGFGGLDERELIEVYENGILLKELDPIARLWTAYQQNDSHTLLTTAKALTDYPFIQQAVEAHITRIPKGNDPGRPVRMLQQIMQELGTQEFGPVFRTFSQREAIYGFGDMQVRRLWEEIVERA